VVPSLECTLFEQASIASHVSNIVDLQFFALEHGSSAKQLEKRKNRETIEQRLHTRNYPLINQSGKNHAANARAKKRESVHCFLQNTKIKGMRRVDSNTFRDSEEGLSL
jgi:hypothetical protein